ncbi:MAG: c-type cytochrome [Bacteroidia bacterium]
MKTNYTVKIFIICAVACFAALMNNCNTPAEKEKATENAGDVMNTSSDVERGRYLVTFGGCDDCHSPKIMTAQGPVVDSTRRLSGHPADAALPEINQSALSHWYLAGQDLTSWVGPWGVSFPANLTPDTATGTGVWTPELFIKIMRTGKHMGSDSGRPILPPMPWWSIGQLTDEDLTAVLAYLHTLPAVSNKVPDPIPPAAN